ncbi:integrase core domain-containing protein [Chlorobaculum sp. MV4-Y]|jgi:putative transposase|uniref:integrase core domain-containing protein n=1 Tax=Chlorobaculum sp. MV4-Y TaxID=2976335 RepID=UPI0021B0473F|nr:integrase core domain-containing protein [Chlorobaculum sp. MV4-Y]UWX57515.1 integrase core domain-containing protein [Chlorobaculum sp. MV4-Y]
MRSIVRKYHDFVSDPGFLRFDSNFDYLSTDQGSQFTSEVFAEAVITESKSALSMDGKGRAIDNVFIERQWGSVKYEYIDLNPPADGFELYKGLKHWVNDYNTVRRHKALDGVRLAKVYSANKRPISEAT